ncbi:MAG: hypothetical protein J6Y19_07300 [Kiritimatiellae bacterium]|nr:hypothetical protein [Kiritimatiellia bacterium]
MTQKQQKAEYEYFKKILGEVLKDPLKAGKYLVIKNETIEGYYDSFENAYMAASAKFAPGSFIIQQAVLPDSVVNYLAGAV